MVLRVRVNTNSKLEKVEVRDDGTVLVNCNATPVNNAANIAVQKILAKHFNVTKNNITILKGARSKDKLIQILY
jgi:uncharacterized protein YggU (UPF0235/DUF167 family)